jgi:hypothetical protein
MSVASEFLYDHLETERGQREQRRAQRIVLTCGWSCTQSRARPHPSRATYLSSSTSHSAHICLPQSSLTTAPAPTPTPASPRPRDLWRRPPHQHLCHPPSLLAHDSVLVALSHCLRLPSPPPTTMPSALNSPVSPPTTPLLPTAGSPPTSFYLRQRERDPANPNNSKP